MKVLKYVLGIVLCAWAGQYFLAMLLPNLIMEVLYHQGGKQAGYNHMAINPLADETARTVVRPSPDLLYASCIYNLEQGPLLLSATIPERYWSMQFYQMNTDNYAGISNQREQRHRVGTVVKVTLISSDDDPSLYEGVVIQSPSDRGMILLRASAIGDHQRQLAALQASSCTTMDTEVAPS